jgi:hypothetical protein
MLMRIQATEKMLCPYKQFSYPLPILLLSYFAAAKMNLWRYFLIVVIILRDNGILSFANHNKLSQHRPNGQRF